MNRRRLTRLAAIGAIAVTGLGTVACSSAGPNEARAENEIRLVVFNDAAAEAEKALAERFNQTSDVQVVIEESPETDSVGYMARIRQSIGTANSPDIFMSWGSAQLQDFVDSGAILPLDDFIAENEALRSSFSPAVFDEEVIDGQAYGIPVRGTQPVFLFNNSQVLADNGLEPAETWDELLDQIGPLSDAGVIPIGLAGASQWPTLMWFQYTYAAAIGNEAVAEALAGDTDVWSSDGSREALQNIRTLVDAGAFGTTFDSVDFDNSPTLLRTGLSAYELMGTWNYAVQAGADEAFAENALGYTAFPAISGGDGEPGELAGNVSNYYNVMADTRYPEAVQEFLALLYSPEFIESELALGNLPTTTDVGDFIADAPGTEASNAFLAFTNDQVQAAPSFQLSWDQVVPTASKQPMLDAMSAYFNGTLDEDGFIDAMTQLEY